MIERATGPGSVPAKRRGRPAAGSALAARPLAEELRAAALMAFATRGFEGATLRQIAAAVGVNESLIVHKFGSKLALWRAAIDDISHRLLEALDERAQSQAGATAATDRLAWAMGQIIDIVCDTPHLAPFIVQEVARHGERFDYFYDRLVKPIRDVLQPLIVETHHSGALGVVDPDLYFVTFASALLMTVASRAILERLTPALADETAFRRGLKSALLAGLVGGTLA